MSGATQGGNADNNGVLQLLPRHRYMLQKVDAAFGIYDENLTEVMFLQQGVLDKVRGARLVSVGRCGAREREETDMHTAYLSLVVRAAMHLWP